RGSDCRGGAGVAGCPTRARGRRRLYRALQLGSERGGAGGVLRAAAGERITNNSVPPERSRGTTSSVARSRAVAASASLGRNGIGLTPVRRQASPRALRAWRSAALSVGTKLSDLTPSQTRIGVAM